ncbi:MAG TPA: hypothetical protein VFE33_25855 [Thermoanaerobaculia bacterium]|nr:hypothetical protein [Thermoanaerobaculia bacterium]
MDSLAERILSVLSRFDFGAKLQLAREMAEILEWQQGEDLPGLIQKALDRDLSRVERSRAETLELILRDREYDPPFPDGFPKMGR